MGTNRNYLFFKALIFFTVIFIFVFYAYKKNLSQIYLNETNESINIEFNSTINSALINLNNIKKDSILLTKLLKYQNKNDIPKVEKNLENFLNFKGEYSHIKLVNYFGDTILETSKTKNFDINKKEYYSKIIYLEKNEFYITKIDNYNNKPHMNIITPYYDKLDRKLGYLYLKVNLKKLLSGFDNSRLSKEYYIFKNNKLIISSSETKHFYKAKNILNKYKLNNTSFVKNEKYYYTIKNFKLSKTNNLKVLLFHKPVLVENKVKEYLSATSWINFLYFLFATFISFIYSETKARSLKDSERVDIVNKIFDNSHDAIVITNKENKIIQVNKAFSKITGYEEKEILGLEPSLLQFPGYHTKQFYKNMWDDLEKERYWQGEITNLKKSNEVYTEDLTISKIITENKDIFYVGSFIDITQDKINRELMKNKIDENKTYLEIINDYLITTKVDRNGKILDVSDKFSKVCGYSKEELIGKNHNIFRHPETTKEFYQAIWQDVYNGKTWQGELKNIKKDGSIYFVHAKISPLYKGNKIIGYASVAIDITDKKRVEEMSITDELTNIYNRRFFNQVIEKELARAKRDNKLIGLAIIDIDYFKQYNDTYGHNKGDKALVSVANTLQVSVNRSSDYCFRLGGEEFGIIVSGLDEKQFNAILEKVRTNIEDLHIPHSSSLVNENVTISIGAVVSNPNDITVKKLYKLADKQLYKSKDEGRNKVLTTKI